MRIIGNVITATLALNPQLGCLAASCDGATKERMDLSVGMFVTPGTKTLEIHDQVIMMIQMLSRYGKEFVA